MGCCARRVVQLWVWSVVTEADDGGIGVGGTSGAVVAVGGGGAGGASGKAWWWYWCGCSATGGARIGGTATLKKPSSRGNPDVLNSAVGMPVVAGVGAGARIGWKGPCARTMLLRLWKELEGIGGSAASGGSAGTEGATGTEGAAGTTGAERRGGGGAAAATATGEGGC